MKIEDENALQRTLAYIDGLCLKVLLLFARCTIPTTVTIWEVYIKYTKRNTCWS